MMGLETGRMRFIFSGSGGQGVITAAIILAEAAVLHEGLNAIQAQSYGAAARGGATRSDVIISREPINYPKVDQANVLVCLTQEAYDKYAGAIRPGGLLVVDPKFVRQRRISDARQRELPLYETVMREIGLPVVFNICMLGAVVGLTGVVRRESALAAVESRVPADFLEKNRRAFSLGLELAA